MIIAIDGPAASGKTTLARALSAHYDIPFIPSGNLYRAITFLILESKINPSDETVISNLVTTDPLDCKIQNNCLILSVSPSANHSSSPISLSNEELRTSAINTFVATVSVHQIVRDYVTRLLRKISIQSDCIVEGRDIGSVVFPNTPYKVFLDAPAEIRQQRRINDGEQDCVITRDHADSSRSNSPLTACKDAIHIDIASKTPQEAVALIVRMIENSAPRDSPL